MAKQNYDTSLSFSVYSDFEQDYKRALKYNRSFSSLMCELFSTEYAHTYDAGIRVKITNKAIFETATSLSTSIYDRITANNGQNNYIPSMQTLITLCMVYYLDWAMVITLLDSLGLRFKRTDKLHHAYCYLINNCKTQTIIQCNNVLREMGFEEKYLLGGSAVRARK